MMYSDQDLKRAIEEKQITVVPYEPKHVNGATLDLTLHNNFRVFRNSSHTHIDVKVPFDITEEVQASVEDGSFVIHPGEFVLGSTAEVISLSNSLSGFLEGRSSLGRIGLIVHATASLVKPGFSGYLTLEMSNISNLPIKLYTGMRIAQLAVVELKTPSSEPYSKKSKYQHQSAPTPSRIWEDFEV